MNDHTIIDAIVDAIVDAYEGENPWAYEDNVTNQLEEEGESK